MGDKGQCILLVEDYEDIRRGLRLTLEMAGHRVVEAADGREAMRKFDRSADQGETFDLALLDYNLPHYKGDVVAKHIKDESARRSLKPPRIIALTGSDDSQMMGRLRTVGVLEVVIKGADDFNALRERIMGAAA